jgi:hypothetical protein
MRAVDSESRVNRCRYFQLAEGVVWGKIVDRLRIDGVRSFESYHEDESYLLEVWKQVVKAPSWISERLPQVIC